MSTFSLGYDFCFISKNVCVRERGVLLRGVTVRRSCNISENRNHPASQTFRDMKLSYKLLKCVISCPLINETLCSLANRCGVSGMTLQTALSFRGLASLCLCGVPRHTPRPALYFVQQHRLERVIPLNVSTALTVHNRQITGL